jgi:hypothetical protein
MHKQNAQFGYANEESFQPFHETESAFNRETVRKICISFFINSYFFSLYDVASGSHFYYRNDIILSNIDVILFVIFFSRSREKCAINHAIVHEGSHPKISHIQKARTVIRLPSLPASGTRVAEPS